MRVHVVRPAGSHLLFRMKKAHKFVRHTCKHVNSREASKQASKQEPVEGKRKLKR